jgi:O-antigen ligase
VRDAQGRLIAPPSPPFVHQSSLSKRNAPALAVPRDSVGSKIIEYGIIVLLILSPLPAASTEEWSILAIELLAAFLTATYVLTSRRPRLNAKLETRLIWPRRLLWGVFAVIGLQIVPLPPAIVRLVSPQAFALREAYAPRFGELRSMSLSLVPSSTARQALLLLSYVLIGFLVVKTITHKRQIQRLMTVLVIMGTLQAFYGLFELYRNNPHVLFYKKIYNVNSATGTFINRNHFSGYLELLIPIALTLVIARIDLFSLAGKRWTEKIAQITGQGFALNVLSLIGVVVMSLGVILSQSRSGVFVLLFIFLMFFQLTVYHFSAGRYRQGWIKNFLKVAFVLITVVALYVGVEATVGRFSDDNLLQEGRPQYWTAVLRMIGDFPIAGTGLGTFGSLYPVYETVPMWGRLLHAHNDYLEFLAELGGVGFVLLLGTVGFLAIDGFRTWSKRRHPGIKGLGMGGFVAVAALLVHSLTDFNLQIPANAVLFTVILALSFSTAYYRKA